MSLNAEQQALWEVFKPKPSPELNAGEVKAFNRIVQKITILPLENDLIQISYEKLSKEEHLIISPSWGLLNLPDEVMKKIKVLDDHIPIGRINLKPTQQVKLIEEERKGLIGKKVFKAGRDVGSRNNRTLERDERLSKLIASYSDVKVEGLFGDEKIKKVIKNMSFSNFSKIVSRIRKPKR